MRIGILGTKWGLTHIGTFRRHGHEITALMGLDLAKTRAIASREGIPIATENPSDLAEVDAVVVSTPAGTHLDYLRLFSGKPILCEKPLTGSRILPGSLEPLSGECVYVNYAFPFLKTARLISSICHEGRLGEVFRIMVAVSPRFDIVHTPIGWFLDDAVHPLSWLNYTFGDFKLVYSHIAKGRPNIAALLTNGNQTLNLDLFEAHTTRLRFDLTIAGTRGVLRTSGGFEPGRFWNFEPVSLNGEPVNEGEFSSPERDIWFEANCEAVGVFLDVALGRITRDDALARGLCDIRKASMIELGLAGMLEKDG